MTNLVATTPVTAKAMQSLLLELHRQKELKRAYRRHYKGYSNNIHQHVNNITTPHEYC